MSNYGEEYLNEAVGQDLATVMRQAVERGQNVTLRWDTAEHDNGCPPLPEVTVAAVEPPVPAPVVLTAPDVRELVDVLAPYVHDGQDVVVTYDVITESGAVALAPRVAITRPAPPAQPRVSFFEFLLQLLKR